MRKTAVLACLVATAAPTLAMSDQQREQMDRASANLRASMEESDRSMRAYYAARRAEERAKCTKLGSPAIGMTAPQVVKTCWGSPISVNETVTAQGRHQQWVYNGGYLYLDGGILTSIQTRR